ncbi:ATP-binding protein [Chromobacterium rhizoryzae]|uniref:ATP-binding protein n=2 Tax=Chromobacterium rhizoryzae TaxID=1778675 RepID=A0AAD0RVF8_9NEIS|nr:ATP-binding protein [Chromobacterium rhizoryzae]
MADWLLNEFHYEDFNELELLLTRRGKRIRLLLGGNGVVCDTASSAALRLGILTDLLGLSDAKVRSRFNSSEFSAFDLSSGEYHMYSSILGLGFGVDNSSVVLIDEPENSLHPQWQQEFMDSVFGISAQALEQGHLLVCTHSPLIVSAALDGSTIVDLTDEIPSVVVASFGASSDEVLLSQFGVGSSRNRVVVDTVQRAVSLVERGGFNNPEFEAMAPDLVSIRQALRSDDPLVDIINALLGEEGV